MTARTARAAYVVPPRPSAPDRAPTIGDGLRRRHETGRGLAVAATVAAVALQPLLQPTGPGNSSPVDAFTVLAVGGVALWLLTCRVPLRAPYAVSVALIVAGGALAALVGELPGTGLITVVQDLVLLAWCLAVVAVASLPGGLRLLARTWAVAGTLAGCVLVTGWLAGVDALVGTVAREGDRAVFTFGDPNYAASYWVSTLFILHAVGVPRSPPLRAAASAILLLALVLTASNGGVVSLLVGSAVLAVAAIGRRQGALVAAVLALLLVGLVSALLALAPLDRVPELARDSGVPLLASSLGRSDTSGAQRSLLVEQSLDLYRDSGPLGVGPAATKPLLAEHQFPYAKEAHDDYLAAITERGPLGVAGVLGLVLSAGVRARRALRGPPAAGELRHPAAVVAALAGLAVDATYYEVLHFRFLWILLAFVAVLASRARTVTRAPL